MLSTVSSLLWLLLSSGMVVTQGTDSSTGTDSSGSPTTTTSSDGAGPTDAPSPTSDQPILVQCYLTLPLGGPSDNPVPVT